MNNEIRKFKNHCPLPTAHCPLPTSHSPLPTSHSPSKGFTIMEILIAVLLASVILGALYGSYSTVIGSTRNYRQVSDIYQVARIVLSNMSREISGAYQPLFAEEDIIFVGEEGWHEGFESDSLSMVTTTCLRGGEEEDNYGAFEVTYRRGIGLREGLLLMNRAPFYNLEEPFEKGEDFILAEKVRALDFEYYDGEEWYKEWLPEDQEKLPYAVRITLALGSEEEEEPNRFSTVAFLPMTPPEIEEEEEEEGVSEGEDQE